MARFPGPAQLTSWAGLTPKHHESDTTVHRGRITKQGSRLVRWAAVEAVQRVGKHTRLGQVRDRICARRGRNIGVVAAARELLTLVYYGLRDEHIRAIAPASTSRTSGRYAVGLRPILGPDAFPARPRPSRSSRRKIATQERT